MPYGTNMYLFQKGIRPAWEDPTFENGCHLSIKSAKFQSSKYWEDLLLAMLGEQFDETDFVLGLVLKLRPQFDKVDLWMRDAS